MYFFFRKILISITMILTLFLFFFFRIIFISASGLFSPFFSFFFIKILVPFTRFFSKLLFASFFFFFWEYLLTIFIYKQKIIKNFLKVMSHFYIYTKNHKEYFLSGSKRSFKMWVLSVLYESLKLLFIIFFKNHLSCFKYNIFCFHKFFKKFSQIDNNGRSGLQISLKSFKNHLNCFKYNIF